jgi:hypothetical protein
MKKHHTSFVLLALFFTALLVSLWAERTDWAQPGDSHLVLPALTRIEPRTVRRVVVDGPRGTIVFEPRDVAADSARVTTLLANLRALRRSSEAGTIEGADATYGFAPPAATVRLYGDDPNAPIAALEIGGVVTGFRDQRYVRALGPKPRGIEVIDSRMVAQTLLPPIDWREKNVFDMPTFYVDAIAVDGPGRALRVKRDDDGHHWAIEQPVSAPADDEKAEGLAAELASLRVAEGDKGFVQDNATDFRPYGLDPPVMTITLKDRRSSFPPQTVDVGKPADDDPDFRYARRRDQDDVVLINAREIADLGKRPNALRSQRVADVNAARATYVAIELAGRTFHLAQTASGWVIPGAQPAPADAPAVAALLTRLGPLQTSEFLEPGAIRDPGVDPPIGRLRVWQADGGDALPSEAPEAPRGKLRVDLRIGRHDPARKTLFGQLEGDRYVLALPESLREVLPRSPLAFRDRTLQTFNPTQISRLSIRRDGVTYDLVAPDTPGKTLHWRMTSPIEGPADDEQASKVAMMLANLRAAELITATPGDDATYGFDHPVVTASWASDASAAKGGKEVPHREGTLRLGKTAPGGETRYARFDGARLVFTLGPLVFEPFLGEFRDHRVLAFRPETVARIVFRWPGRTLSFVPRSEGPPALPAWAPEPGVDPAGFDVSKLNKLLEGLSRLQTERFAQYLGIFPEAYGLTPPRLAIELQFDGAKPKTLRLGNATPDGSLFATAEAGAAGAAFFLQGPAWIALATPPAAPEPARP